MKDIMIDIETLGTGPYSVILSIAAVEFNIITGAGGAEFYERIDPEECQKHSLKTDAATALWWMQQSDEARNELTRNKEMRLPVMSALRLLSRFLEERGHDVKIWANSPSFDCARLREAYEVCDLQCPWSYKQELDFRTVATLFPNIPKVTSRVAHNALNDCYNQIEFLVTALGRIR